LGCPGCEWTSDTTPGGLLGLSQRIGFSTGSVDTETYRADNPEKDDLIFINPAIFEEFSKQ
jgi:hypothetical protein